MRKHKTIGTWLHRVYFFLWDDMYDYIDPGYRHDWLTERVEKYIENPILWLLCKIYGHEPVMDQCAKPEHDHCVYCNKLLPNMVSRPDRKGN